MLCFTCEEITDAHVSLESILLHTKPHCDALVTKIHCGSFRQEVSLWFECFMYAHYLNFKQWFLIQAAHDLLDSFCRISVIRSSALYAQRSWNTNINKARAQNVIPTAYFVACLVRQKYAVLTHTNSLVSHVCWRQNLRCPLALLLSCTQKSLMPYLC